jgi:DNA-binding CsgD family transcriptional regulator
LARLHTHAHNARITRLARAAVDVAGLGVVFVDAQGRIAWCSPQAAVWLQTLRRAASAGQPGQPGQLPRALEAALQAERDEVVRTTTDPPLSVRNMGRATMGETMLLLELQLEGPPTASRLAHAALTPRETEGLSWLTKGKTNRDIADILVLSHRTINKHLEHIFEKLGVETRSAAAALASGQLKGVLLGVVSENEYKAR